MPAGWQGPSSRMPLQQYEMGIDTAEEYPMGALPTGDTVGALPSGDTAEALLSENTAEAPLSENIVETPPSENIIKPSVGPGEPGRGTDPCRE